MGPISHQTASIKRHLPEFIELQQLIKSGRHFLRPRTLANINVGQQQIPLLLLEMGSTAADAPALGLIGGIHGVERIGTQVILAYLKTLLKRLEWDRGAVELLGCIKLFIIPMVNPGGMWNNTRCNPNGVDLMRNAPVEASGAVPLLLGGAQDQPSSSLVSGR